MPFSVNSIQTTKDTLFTVSGTGEATAVPDTAMVSLGVTKTASTVEEAQNQVNETINTITKDLKQLGIEEKDIKTSNYNVNPNYDYTSGKNTVTGYTVNANLDVKVKDIEKANKAVDAATKDGANQIGNVQFVLNDEKKKELENQARKKAIDEAKEKAKSISDAAGIKLGKIINIQESGENPTIYPMAEARALDMKSAGGEPTQLNPGENKVSITVSLSYETY